MKEITPKAATVLRYIKQYSNEKGVLKVPIRSLAKIVFQREQGLFNTVDSCRKYISNSCNKATARTNKHVTAAIPKVVSTIEEGLRKRKLFTTPKKMKDTHLSPGLWGVLCDIHFPEQHGEALAAALQNCKDSNVDGLIINGDMLDMYNGSRFLRETKRPSIREEIAMGRDFLSFLREEFGDIPIIYKFGNHEERLRHFVLNNAREIEDLEGMSLEEQLKLKDFGVQQVNREIIWAGKLAVLHGHEMQNSFAPPVNPARGAFLRAKCSVLIGHHHHISQHREGNLKGDMFVTYSVACLSTLAPEYNPYGYTKWANGFAKIDVRSSGNYRVFNHEIIKGEVF